MLKKLDRKICILYFGSNFHFLAQIFIALLKSTESKLLSIMLQNSLKVTSIALKERHKGRITRTNQVL
jgi:hypothetical protein